LIADLQCPLPYTNRYIMSNHSDEQHPENCTDSFWEIGNYKRTSRRIEDGHRLCDDLMRLVSERAEIEKAYAKQLREWGKKWGSTIEKGPEYGTMEAAWKAVVAESERVCDMHLRVKDALLSTVHQEVKGWQRENYHKSMMGQLKERRDTEEAFRKAQKAWSKAYERCGKARHDYHHACKAERSAVVQERNATGDSGLSPDQVKKLQERVTKTKEEVTKTREKYEAALKDISEINPRYIEEMTQVFEKAQESEQKRLKFFKDMLFETHKCLNVSADPSLPRIYEEFKHTVENADFDKDLRWWSNNHGVNMPMNWPAYEEYSEEFRDISGRGRKGAAIPEGAITLLHQRPVSDDVQPEYDPDRPTGASLKRPTSAPAQPPAPAPATTSPTSSKASDNRNSAISNGVSGGEEDDWDYSDRVDAGKEGVPVKALYDYEGLESDELSFKCGDVFEKLEDEDEQGWCTGRKDGVVGLYPANYVQEV